MNLSQWSRRHWLSLWKPLLLAPLGTQLRATFGGGERAAKCFYRADATILLLSIPIFSKAGVGSGFAFVEQLAGAARSRQLGFGGGSWPDRAHGLNRLGYIQESVAEATGRLAEADYFGFMSTSKEERLEDAKAALNQAQQEALFSAIQGETKPGAYSASFTRFLSRDATDWRQWRKVAGAAERSFQGECVSRREERGAPAGAGTVTPTLLHSLLRAREAGFAPTRGHFIYGGILRSLETTSTSDEKTGERLRQRGLVPSPARVVRMTGLIRNPKTGDKTRFSIWWDKDPSVLLPLRIELQPKSFLRLAFEADRSSKSDA